jgi:hypothetical protein
MLSTFLLTVRLRFWLSDEIRKVTVDSYGRNKIKKTSKHTKTGFIKLTYGSRALEWLNIRLLFLDLLIFYGFSHLCPIV